MVSRKSVEQKDADGGGEERADPVVGAVGPAMEVGRPVYAGVIIILSFLYLVI